MTISQGVFGYLGLGAVLVLAGAFKLTVKNAIGSEFAMQCALAVNGDSERTIGVKIYLFKLLVYVVAIILWPHLIFAEKSFRKALAQHIEEDARRCGQSIRFVANKDNLIRRYSIEEAEIEHTTDDPEGRVPNVAFGFINARWNSLKSGLQPGDELWSFSSDGDSGPHSACQAGVAVVRNGEIVDEIICVMS